MLVAAEHVATVAPDWGRARERKDERRRRDEAWDVQVAWLGLGGLAVRKIRKEQKKAHVSVDDTD
jgi:hypothetical protein